MSTLAHYILSFLCGDDNEAVCRNVCYTADSSEWENYRLAIVPCGLFEAGCFLKAESLPKPPFATLRGVPVPFGKPEISRHGNTLVLHADLVAAAFFMLSRYEECVNPKRDNLGRFLAQHSVMQDYLDRCLVDEWGELLTDLLRETGLEIPERKKPLLFTMTHDADKIEQYRNFRGFVGGVLRGQAKTAFKSFFGGIENDPLFTFPYMKSVEDSVDGLNTILFVKTGGKTLPEDKPCYSPFSKDIQKMLAYYPNVGLHLSFEAAQNMELAAAEKELLEAATGKKITANRNHYLASLHPRDLVSLERIGITDDYTMGYADRAGFRLGTCRPVNFINPETLKVHSLVLHPLCIMDRSLDSAKYMNLGYDAALDTCRKLISQARQHGGEFTMLWHNNSLSSIYSEYHKKLFGEIVKGSRV